MSSGIDARIADVIASLPEQQQSIVKERLARVLVHRKALRRFPTPGHLAQFSRPGFLQTPMLDEVDKAIMAAESGEHRRWIINTPPQEGKTSRLQDGCAWLLLRHPTLRIAFASYEQGIAAQSGLAIRQLIETHGNGYRGQPVADRVDVLGLMLDPDRALQTNWSLADVPGSAKKSRPGGVMSVGIGSALTGKAVDVLIIDDPLKDAKQADSPIYRRAVQAWFQSVASTRLAPNAIVIVIQCMTGDTPVLMGDGREKPLRDVRPGDTVATFEDGALTTSTVRNWADQGPDTIYAIKMKSGRTVRANARHPFLTIQNGEYSWQRTEALRPGSIIQTVTGGSTEASPALSTDAASTQSARACAPRITTNIAGLPDTAPLPSLPRSGERRTSSTDTASPQTRTPHSSMLKEGAAPSAESFPVTETRRPIGKGNSASITITSPDASEDCSATTATSPLGTANQPPYCVPPLTTWSPEADEVVSVEACGTENVFDIQVDRTENFIANGLVSHNTRWHEDDLTGWLIGQDLHNIAPVWRHINIPAQAGKDDVLGRQPGEYMLSARGRTKEDWEATKKAVGSRWWFALYQGDPSPPEGGTFQRAWFDKHRVLDRPELKYVMTVVDPADNDGTGDEAGIVTGGLGADGDFYVLEDNSGHYTIATWVRLAIFAYLRNGASRIGYEKSLSGLKRSIAAEWKNMRTQARELARARKQWVKFDDDTDWGPVNALAIADVRDALSDEDDSREEKIALERKLIDLWQYVPRIMAMPLSGPPLKAITAIGSKTVRAEFVSPTYENGQTHHVGFFPALEHSMATWLPTQDSPDRMDAVVHLITELSKMSGTVSISGPPKGNIARRQAPLPTIMRSTRYGR